MTNTEFVAIWKDFDALSNRELHDLLRLRQDIFIVEQECPYTDIDGKDVETMHYLLWDQEKDCLAAAIRVFLPEEGKNEARIGRVVTSERYRGRGLGRKIMSEGVEKLREISPGASVLLSAQAHLEAFYGSFGFTRVSEDYMEDGIPHLDMVLKLI